MTINGLEYPETCPGWGASACPFVENDNGDVRVYNRNNRCHYYLTQLQTFDIDTECVIFKRSRFDPVGHFPTEKNGDPIRFTITKIVDDNFVKLGPMNAGSHNVGTLYQIVKVIT